MNDSIITVHGNVGTEPKLNDGDGHPPVVNFRLACTPRKFNRSSGQWSDADTQWYSVSAWRSLGENVAASLHKGDPVVVHGRMLARSYVNKERVEVNTFEIEAMSIGHDLNRGRTIFSKTASSTRGPASAEPVEQHDERVESLKQAQLDWGAAPAA